MNLGELEVRIYLGFDCNDLIFSSDQIEKGAQVWVHASSLCFVLGALYLVRLSSVARSG
jgi:hypothetical protein